MSAPLPEALRARVQTSMDEGARGRAAALRLKLAPAAGARWALAVRRRAQGRAGRRGRPEGRGNPDPHRAFFAGIIGQDGGTTRPEPSAALFDATGVRAHRDAIGKLLRKPGCTQRKGHWLPPDAAAPR